jgi:hypothetical protein
MLTCPQCGTRNLNSTQKCVNCNTSLESARLKIIEQAGQRLQETRSSHQARSSFAPRNQQSQRPQQSGARQSPWDFGNAVLGSKDESRIFEQSNQIKITKNTVSYGGSVYQVKNITGFQAGLVPKDPLPIKTLLILAGFSMIAFIASALNALIAVIGIAFLIFGAFIVMNHYEEPAKYGLILFLNSGKERIFISQDRMFLTNIVSEIYRFMENPSEGYLYIDMSNKSINVGGNFQGSANTGNNSAVG